MPCFKTYWVANDSCLPIFFLRNPKFLFFFHLIVTFLFFFKFSFLSLVPAPFLISPNFCEIISRILSHGCEVMLTVLRKHSIDIPSVNVFNQLLGNA